MLLDAVKKYEQEGIVSGRDADATGVWSEYVLHDLTKAEVGASAPANREQVRPAAAPAELAGMGHRNC